MTAPPNPECKHCGLHQTSCDLLNPKGVFGFKPQLCCDHCSHTPSNDLPKVELIKKIYAVMMISETEDVRTPYRCLPAGSSEWIAAKIERLAHLVDSLSAEKDKEIERLKAAPKVSITADAKAVVWSEERLSNYRSEMGKVRDILVHYASLPPFEDGKVRLKMGCGKALEGIAIINQMIGEE